MSELRASVYAHVHSRSCACYPSPMNMQATLLIVDDDVDIRNLLGAFLRPHGYETHLASDGVEMRRILASHAVDLIILDIMLPGVDGLTLCRQLRTHSAVPIIMLTAIGADDYLNKPFHPRELLARIKAVLRRAQNSAYEKVSNKNPIYHFAGWKLDTGARRLISPDQLEVSVTSGRSEEHTSEL